MAVSDSTVPLSIVDGTLTLNDGAAHTITVGLIQTEWSWTREGAKSAEALVRGQHMSPPVIRKIGDGNITGNFTALVATLYGSAGPSLDEWLMFTNGASAYTSTSGGDRKTLKAILAANASAAAGASQTYSFNYCEFSNVKVDPGGTGGLWSISADFIDHEENFTRA